jgi:hypothetical protein
MKKSKQTNVSQIFRSYLLTSRINCLPLICPGLCELVSCVKHIGAQQTGQRSVKYFANYYGCFTEL